MKGIMGEKKFGIIKPTLCAGHLLISFLLSLATL